MSDKKCDNFGDFFIYRLENITSRSAKSSQDAQSIKKAIKANEDAIKDEFNFYLDAKMKSKEEVKKKGIVGFFIEAWRPIMMYLFMLIIGQYYLINPIIEFLWPMIKLKELPSEMWTLLTVAVGGYITSRGVEKGIQIWKQNTQQQVIVPGEYPMNPGGGFDNQIGPDQMFSDASQGQEPGMDENNMIEPTQNGSAPKEEDLV